MDLEKTISDVLAGDLDAFTGVIESYHVAVRNFVATTFPSSTRVDELAQETFVRVYRQLPTYDPSQAFWPWLRGIAHNVVREELRAEEKAARERRAFAEAALWRAADHSAQAAAEETAQVDALGALRGCVEKLSEQGRRLVDWFYHQDLTSDEIAGKLDCGSSAVRNALVRARRSLRECVERSLQEV